MNATDLRLMKYPDRETASSPSEMGEEPESLTQAMMDDQLKKLTK